MNNEKWLSFIASLLGFVFTGLVYTVVSFAYIQSTFATKVENLALEARISRVEVRLNADIKAINDKLDNILIMLAK